MVKDNFLLPLDYKNITFTFFPYFSLHPNVSLIVKVAVVLANLKHKNRYVCNISLPKTF